MACRLDGAKPLSELIMEYLGTNFSEILTGIQTFSFKKMQFKMSSVKWRSFCLGFNVLRIHRYRYCVHIVYHLGERFHVTMSSTVFYMNKTTPSHGYQAKSSDNTVGILKAKYCSNKLLWLSNNTVPSISWSNTMPMPTNNVFSMLIETLLLNIVVSPGAHPCLEVRMIEYVVSIYNGLKTSHYQTFYQNMWIVGAEVFTQYNVL